MDYLASNCGPLDLYGGEITKPRQNAATATLAERNAYRQAIVDVGTLPSYVFFGGVSYWHKQDEVHQGGPSNRHSGPAFLPWHRELLNRYEVLLQEANPTVRLMYWDWTTDPANSTGGFNFFTSSFMGASGRGTGGAPIGLPFSVLAPPSVTRNLSVSTTPPMDPDSVILGSGPYQTFRSVLENVPNHNSAHGYIGGGGNMSFINTAAEDPFFFLLHGNADRLWAEWQRDPANLTRLAPATAYDAQSSNINITTVMRPWDGTGPSIQPWTVAGGYSVSKTPQHASVVAPPIYDTAPLVIPVLQPGEAVVLQIPWYPPNPADFACFGGDQGHFCLLGRIETAITAPFGMTTPEGAAVYTNTKNNNNIGWKNITVVDNFPGALGFTSILVRNIFRERVAAGLRFADTQEIGASFFDFGRIMVDLKPELYQRWRAGGGAGQGIEPVGGTTRLLILTPDAFIQNIPLEPGEVFSIDVQFELRRDYRLPRGVTPKWDLIQTGGPDDPRAIVGGQRFEVNFQRLSLVKPGREWRYLDTGVDPGPTWLEPDFDDSKWKRGRAEFGFGDDPVTLIDGGPPTRRHITTYFRHTFEVAEPGFYRSLLLRLKRDDGAVVYLNGREIHRVNLPTDRLTPDTLATRDVRGLEEEVFYPIPLPDGPQLLRQGRNVIAVAIHQAAPDSPDLSFDLELAANPAVTRFSPDVAFASPRDGGLFQTDQIIPIEVEALDHDGRVVSVTLLADGQPIGVDDEAPFIFQWRGASRGIHRLRAVALDNDQQRSTAELTITVLDNTPPIINLTQPVDGAMFEMGDPIRALAEASDPGGAVERVDFYLRDANLFMAQDQLVDSATVPPYTIDLPHLAPGHYALTAIARDTKGAFSPSLPIHFEVHVTGQPTMRLYLPHIQVAFERRR